MTGSRRSCAPRPTGSRSILRAQGEGQAIQTVFQAIHDGNPDQSLLAYQYLQMMPKIAEGGANKLWIVPSEIGKALEGLGSTMTDLAGIPQHPSGSKTRVDMGSTERAAARRQRRRSATPSSGRPTRLSRRRSRRPPRPPTRGAAAAAHDDRPGRRSR